MAIQSTELEYALSRAVAFMHREQLPTGEFKSYHSTHPTMDGDCELDSTPFPTALIAYSLAFHEVPEVHEMIAKATQFFLRHMERGGVWRYWTYKHPLHSNIPVDTDDTVCVSAVLRQQKIAFPDNRDLILANRNAQGVLYTWFVPHFPYRHQWSFWKVALKIFLNPIGLYGFWKITEARPDDVDGVVNANALYYLGADATTQPVIDYLVEIIREKREAGCDKWHLSPFNFYYALSRNYPSASKSLESVRSDIVSRISEYANEDGSIGKNVLETALAANSLMNCNSWSPVLEKAIRFVLDAQMESGSWRRLAMWYAGPKYGGPDYYYGWGSEELTTGICIESLSRFHSRQQHSSNLLRVCSTADTNS